MRSEITAPDACPSPQQLMMRRPGQSAVQFSGAIFSSMEARRGSARSRTTNDFKTLGGSGGSTEQEPAAMLRSSIGQCCCNDGKSSLRNEGCQIDKRLRSARRKSIKSVTYLHASNEPIRLTDAGTAASRSPPVSFSTRRCSRCHHRSRSGPPTSTGGRRIQFPAATPTNKPARSAALDAVGRDRKSTARIARFISDCIEAVQGNELSCGS